MSQQHQLFLYNQQPPQQQPPPQQHQQHQRQQQQQQQQQQHHHHQQQQQPQPQQEINIIQTLPQAIPRLSHPTSYHLQQTQLRHQKAIAVSDGTPNNGAPNGGAPNNGSLPTPNNSFNNGSTIDPSLITAGQQLPYNGAANAINTIKQESTDIQQTEMDYDHPQSFLSPQSNSPLGSPTNLDNDELSHSFNPQSHLEIIEIPSPYAESPHNSYNSQTSMSLPVQFATNNEWFNPNFEAGSYPLLYSTTTPEMNYLSIMDSDGTENAQKAAMLSEKKRRRRESHNAVERRRRDNINEQIQELSRLLPDVYMDSSNKPNKGLILRKSVDYIKHLKNTVDIQSNQMVKLESKFKQLETSDTPSFSFVGKNVSNINNSNNDNK